MFRKCLAAPDGVGVVVSTPILRFLELQKPIPSGGFLRGLSANGLGWTRPLARMPQDPVSGEPALQCFLHD